MPITIESPPKRIFVVKNNDDEKIEISDPNPQLTPKEIIKHLSGIYPHVLNSSIKGPMVQKDGSFKFEISGQPGTFG